MSTYVTFYRYTDEGIKQVKKHHDIAQRWEKEAKDRGINVKAIYWLQGPYDAMTIVESSDEEAVNALLYAIGAEGYMRSETMRAFSPEQFKNSLQKLEVAGAARR